MYRDIDATPLHTHPIQHLHPAAIRVHPPGFLHTISVASPHYPRSQRYTFGFGGHWIPQSPPTSHLRPRRHLQVLVRHHHFTNGIFVPLLLTTNEESREGKHRSFQHTTSSRLEYRRESGKGAMHRPSISCLQERWRTLQTHLRRSSTERPYGEPSIYVTSLGKDLAENAK